jgi:hypothetical protein
VNRVRRDYCNLGKHPRWKAWIAKYGNKGFYWDMNNKYLNENQHLGNFCTFCDTEITTMVGSGSPDKRKEARKAILQRGV